MKYLKKCLFYIILSVGAIFYSCSSSDDEIIIPPDPTLKLKANKTQIIPFEDLKISIDVDLEVLYDNYDSITWKANGVAYGHFLIFGHPWSNIDDERDLRITEYRIGKNKTYAIGYKDGEIISIDSIEYEVVEPNKDFISIKWGENKSNAYFHHTTGCTPNQYLPTYGDRISIGGVNLQLSHIVSNVDKEYATLELMPWRVTGMIKSSSEKGFIIPDIGDFDWHSNTEEGKIAQYELEYAFHHNYLTELYGPSSFIYEGEDITQNTLEEEYAKRFTYRHRPDSFYPVEIWDTQTSYICISQANNWAGPAGNQRGICTVVAQPRY